MIFSNLCAGHSMVYTMLDNAIPVFVQNYHCLLRPSISFDKRGRSNFALHPKVIHNHLNPSKSLAQFNNAFKKNWYFFWSHELWWTYNFVEHSFVTFCPFSTSIVYMILQSCCIAIGDRNGKNQHTRLCILTCSHFLEDYKNQYMPLFSTIEGVKVRFFEKRHLWQINNIDSHCD